MRFSWYHVVSFPFTKSISGPRKASYRSERQVSQGRNYHRKGSSDKSKRRRNWVVDWSTFPTLLNKTWTRNYQTHFVKVNEFQNGCFPFILSVPFWTKKYSSLPDNRAANRILILEKVHPTRAYLGVFYLNQPNKRVGNPKKGSSYILIPSYMIFWETRVMNG